MGLFNLLWITDSFQNLVKAINLFRGKKMHVFIQFCFYLIGVDESQDKSHWFLDLLINLWFLMRQEASNNTTKLSRHKRRPGRLVRRWKDSLTLPQLIFPAQENLEQRWLLEVGQGEWFENISYYILCWELLSFKHIWVSDIKRYLIQSDDLRKVCNESE